LEGLTNSALPPSPLALPDNVEYFSATAQKLGNSPSSGVVIQSPDGQTAGIYFHPRSKTTSRNASSNNIEKEKIQLGPTLSRKQSTSRMVKEDTMTFSSLYGTPQKTAYTPIKSSPSPPPDIAVPDVQKYSPSPTSGPTTVPSPMKIITTPLDNQQLKPSTPSPSSTRSTSRRSEDSRATQAAPAVGLGEGNGSPTKRASYRRPPGADNKDAKETASPLSAKQKGKMSLMGDANVVPPISVLIVDGMWC
jgi:osomolarity two-component system response regulator SSK1